MVVPSLPIEIVEHIIKQSLPPLRSTAFQKRYELLRTFALVDSRWRVVAQRELGKHVLLKKTRFEKIAVLNGFVPEYLKQATSVWVEAEDGKAAALRETAFRILKECRRVQELAVGWTTTESKFYWAAQDLRSLKGHGIDFLLEATIPSFSRLTYLELVEPLLASVNGVWSRFLNPTTLPSLRCLKLHRHIESDFVRGDPGQLNDLNDVFDPLLSLAAQLQVLAIHEVGEQDIINRFKTEDWKRFDELQYLAIGKGSNCLSTWSHTPDSIPPKLKTLVILDLGDGSDQDEVYQELQGVVAQWRGEIGRQLVIKRQAAVEKDDAGAVMGARESLLRSESAERRQIVVREVLANGSFDDWETFFDVW
ncbi:hypothetical protein BCR35DRAFT_334561 [Leucosporidium creatinivorum]|uniref:F-box domain-containing protein n=1 Tax=Leucosporidium creatinivorum TaxID=106004 RepID=A0A1Y2E503_9BASI|nr:hypothetical protein BCR35DRAFT_334561 [Leucosporidium creatinivorum]